VTTRLVIFDCDGTLSDGQAAICHAMAQAFALVDLPAPDPQRVRRIVGLSLPHAIRSLAPDAADEVITEAVAAYKQAFFAMRQAGLVREELYPGIADLVRGLHGAGFALGVATGKSNRGLTSTLTLHGLDPYFSSLQTADRHPSKPDPAMLLAAMDETLALPQATVMVGDTVFDMHAARAAGTHALGVAWGYHETDELLAAGASAVAASAEELKDLIHAITAI
jgi:phosphoglycolate phosphatase